MRLVKHFSGRSSAELFAEVLRERDYHNIFVRKSGKRRWSVYWGKYGVGQTKPNENWEV